MRSYIFGHKNPDTDTVCSSIALSYLKNALGSDTTPKVLGNINRETKFVLDYFKVDIPSYLNDVRIRIKDVSFNKKALIYENASIYESYLLMRREDVTALPLIDKNNLLKGYVTLKELIKYLIDGDKELVKTSFNNILNVLEGTEVKKCTEEIIGYISDSIIITDDYGKIINSLDKNTRLIILINDTPFNNVLINMASDALVNVIKTNLSLKDVLEKIRLSNYIKNINANENPITVDLEDSYFDFKSKIHKINHTNYPVINKKRECFGLIRLTGVHEFKKRKVILVDHNNLDQTVDGIEEAEILEVIDHHNLGSLGTKTPINFYSKPVGCTSTIIYEMFKEKNVDIPKNIAGLMLSAIISDTLLLTSPTTTEEDKLASFELSSIAGVNLKEFGEEMIKAASSIKDMKILDVIKSDFKTYKVNDKTLGIGIVMTTDFDYINKRLDEFLSILNEMVNTIYSNVLLLFTDLLKNGSYVLYDDKSEELIKESFGLNDCYEGIFLNEIVSRKKQMLPSIMNVLDNAID